MIVKTTRFAATFRGISRQGSAFLFLRSILAHMHTRN